MRKTVKKGEQRQEHLLTPGFFPVCFQSPGQDKALESDLFYISHESCDGVGKPVLRLAPPVERASDAKTQPIYRLLGQRLTEAHTRTVSSFKSVEKPEQIDGSLIVEQNFELYNPHVLSLSDTDGIFGDFNTTHKGAEFAYYPTDERREGRLGKKLGLSPISYDAEKIRDKVVIFGSK